METIETWQTNTMKRYNKLLTRDEEIAFSKIIQNGGKAGKKARDKFIYHNWKLVYKIANKFKDSGMEYSDLIAEGNLGLMKAVDKFDYSKGYKFSTYATYWIRYYMLEGVFNKSRMISLPVRKHKLYQKIIEARTQLSQQLGQSPSDVEIANYIGGQITTRQVSEVCKINVPTLELDKPFNNPLLWEYTPKMWVQDSVKNGPLAYAKNKEIAQKISHIVTKKVTNKEHIDIFIKYYGIGYDGNGDHKKPVSIASLAREYKWSKKYVGSIIDKVLITLQKNKNQIAGCV